MREDLPVHLQVNWKFTQKELISLKIKSLSQKQVLELIKENIKNRVASEENEQYGRKLCLRIDGIPTEKKVPSENVLDKVPEMWTSPMK